MTRPLHRFGGWVVERPLGRGGMATVYRCHHHTDPARLAAIKVLHDAGDRGEQETRLRRFAREVRVLQRLDHPGIVRVLESGTRGGVPWIALELVPGEPLGRSDRGPMPVLAVLDLGVQLTEALAHAHRVGVFHRDVKPSNVIVGPQGTVHLVDFGVASAIDEDTITDPSRRAPGTLVYAPPEWFDLGAEAAPALADAYSVGVLLCELLTGAAAFSHDGFLGLLQQKTTRPGLDPGDGVPAAIRELVSALTQPDPAARLSMEEALARLVAARLALPEDGCLAPVPLAPIPEPADAFVGRQAELHAARSRLQDGARLVTLAGPAGIGKSRLALRVARQDGRRAVLCDLSGARNSEDLLRTVGRALAVPLAEEGALERIGPTLARAGGALVVLDNVDRIVGPVADALRDWLQRLPMAVWVVTSRERLRVPGEWVLTLRPLDEEAAVRLLVARARERVPRFRRTDDNAAALAEVARAVDGLPLALELAAGQVPELLGRDAPPGALDPLELLVGGRAGRHGTLDAALHGSWDLLTAVSRSVWCQCAVFEGAFPLDAAEAVVETPGTASTLAVLQGLVDLSLLQVRRREGGFAMLRTMRPFALERLADSGSAEAVGARHAAWFASLAQGAATRAMPLTEGEVDNVRAACDWSVARARSGLALRSAAVLGASAARSGPPLPAIARLRAALALPEGSPADRTRVSVLLGTLLWRALRTREALAVLRGIDAPGALLALAVAGSRDVPAEVTLALLDAAVEGRTGSERATALTVRGRLGWSLGVGMDAARADLDAAASMLADSADPVRIAALGVARAAVLGEPLERASRLARRAGQTVLQIEVALAAGAQALRRRDLGAAEHTLIEAREAARRAGFLGLQVDAVTALVDVALGLKRFSRAGALCALVLALRGEEEATAHASVCDRLGRVAAGRGRREEAEAWFRAGAQRAASSLRSTAEDSA